MSEVFYIEVNGRGVKSDTISREIVDSIATAALQESKVAISYMAYGDDPVRIGIPMKSYAAISSKWENMEGEVARYNPEKIHVNFILDATLAKGIERWANFGRRSILEKNLPNSIVIVNTSLDPKDYLKYLPKTDFDYTLITVDGGNLEKPSILPLLGAFIKNSSIISEKSLTSVLSEKFLDLREFRNVEKKYKKINVPQGEGGLPAFGPAPKLPHVSDMFEGIVVTSVPCGGRNPDYRTSSSRTYRPEINYQKCINCRTCWILCPDGAIDLLEKNQPSIDYDYCTGCGICTNNCPVAAITSKIEFKEA
jgi:pyruvate ferredoxin oxidoreductase delta subunit